ncbi:MAG TPA: helix-turn-helix transcriptional regulator [Candidatus Polarisedimenticolia bacterium]|nr:helix-turn-helix transcriptional regulator [Candidatus Polarisedimenticolia bacterium]
MTEWKYPGDDAERRAFARNILKIIKEKGLTIEEFERSLAEARKGFDAGVHERAFGRAVKNLRQERKITRKALAASAGIPVRMLIQVERGHGGRLISVPEVCRIAAALKQHPHELMTHYQDAVKQADSAQAWWRP